VALEYAKEVTAAASSDADETNHHPNVPEERWQLVSHPSLASTKRSTIDRLTLPETLSVSVWRFVLHLRVIQVVAYDTSSSRLFLNRCEPTVINNTVQAAARCVSHT